MSLEYTTDDELGDAGLYWLDGDGTLIDFSDGYTFALDLYDPDESVLTKTEGIVGATGSLSTNTPNVTVSWAVGELDLAPGVYELRCVATRTEDDKTRTFRAQLKIVAP